MIEQYDHCAMTFEPSHKHFVEFVRATNGSDVAEIRSDKYIELNEVCTRLRDKKWSNNWLLGWRDITNATNERTVIAAFLPIGPTDDTLSLLLPRHDAKLAAALLAALNSIVLDYVAQQKIGGTHVRKYALAQLPIPLPRRFEEVQLDFIVERVVELSFTTSDLQPIAQALDYHGQPFPWDPERRATLRAELDAYFAKLYGLDRDELRYILDPSDVYGDDYPSETFRVLKKNEIKEFGEYRTQRLVLEAWDRIEEGDFEVSAPGIRRAVAGGLALPNIPELPDGVWARPQKDPRAETGAQLGAILKAMDQPLPEREVRLAIIFALEPRRLLNYLGDEEKRHWRRVVGSEADPLPSGAVDFVARADPAWGNAIRFMRTNGHLLENQHDGTWAPGRGLDTFPSSGWPDGRAQMVLAILQRETAERVAAELPDQLREWANAAA